MINRKTLFTAIIAFTVLGTGTNAFSADYVQGGTTENFAKDSPILTVRIDKTRLTKDNLRLDVPSNNVGDFRLDGDEIRTGSIKLASASAGNWLNNFSMVFKDAAVLSDDSRSDLILTLNDINIFPESYDVTDSFYLVRIVPKGGSTCAGMPAMLVYSASGQRFGLKTDMKVRVADAATNDTFLFTAYDISVSRDRGFNERIGGTGHPYGFSESMSVASGGMSPLFTPSADTYKSEVTDVYYVFGPNVYDSWAAKREGAGVVGVSGGTNSYNSGFAIAGDASSGIVIHTRTSASFNTGRNQGLIMCLLPGGITHASTSSSGVGGKIELWADGKVDSDVDKLDGGTAEQKRTYDIPYGKAVTYKITPDDGYELTELKAGIDGALAVVEPTRTVYKDDDVTIDHYEFDFAGTNTGHQEIQASWRSINGSDAGDVADNPQTNDNLISAAAIVFFLSSFVVIIISRFGRRAGNS